MGRLLRRLLGRLGPHAARPWFPPVMATSAAADYVFFAASPQLLLVVTVLLRGERWRSVPWLFAGASALGAVAVTLGIAAAGEALMERFPGGDAASLPAGVAGFVAVWGPVALFALCALPLPMRSPVFIAALAGMPAVEVGLAVFGGRLVACHLIAVAAATAPARLARVARLRPFLESLGACVDGGVPTRLGSAVAAGRTAPARVSPVWRRP